MEGVGFMKKEKIFKYEASPYHPGKWVIAVDHEKFFLKGTKGSYNIIQARVMGLSYANYLRLCRDVYGAEILGKGTLYPVAYFSSLQKINDLIDQLNIRANAILYNRQHPDNKIEVKF